MSGGREPIRDWLRGLPQEDRRAIGTKKTQKTPAGDLDLARRRMKAMQA